MRTAIAFVVPLLTALCAVPAEAQQPPGKPVSVKIGVLSDMSGLYADIGGPGSVVAAKWRSKISSPTATV